MRLVIALLLASTACSGEEPIDVEWQTLDGLEYAVPDGWSVRDQSDLERKVLTWTPSDNPRKESIVVMRTKPLQQVTSIGLPRIQSLLDTATVGLPAGKFGKAQRTVTPKGMAGMRVDGAFVPDGSTEPYQRIHVVMLDSTSLVHVLYTAKTASSSPDALQLVLNTIHRAEG